MALSSRIRLKAHWCLTIAFLSLGALTVTTNELSAAEALRFTLNWTAKADHAPYYYALQQGWYKDAGIDLTIEGGRGSAGAVQRVAAGAADGAVADFATMMLAKGKGADLMAVMAVYTVSPQYFYWLKSSGIKGPKDFIGKRIGAPAGDAAVAMWPSFAKAVGIDPSSVTFVNITTSAKLSALKTGAVDIIPEFYDAHDTKLDEFGDNVAFVGWREYGLNPYGNSIFFSQSYVNAHRSTVEQFVKISQKAFAVCVKTFTPCLDAVMAHTSGLSEEAELKKWERIKFLMNDHDAREIALGWIDGERVARDYKLIAANIGFEKPFDPKTTFTTEFLDRSIHLDASNIEKE